jgi:spore maturation protein CgeB
MTPSAGSDLPTTLAGFRDFHQGATILVCGCGASLNELSCPERFITIGVNDVGRRFDPTYLVVLNPRNQFTGDRFRYVEQSRAQAVFTQLDLGIPHPHVVRFPLGSQGGADFSNPEILHYTSNSPYLAVCLAVHLGARRIGLIGVDFTDHHFFATTGRHPLTARLNQIDREYAALERACRERGIAVVNLSQQSLLTAFPKGNIENFLNQRHLNALGEREAGTNRRVFFVNYRFLSCGEVFTDGLRNAARELGIQAQDAYWDDPQLPAKVRDFGPDLLFVVHGRRFVQRWGGTFRSYNSAVWLLDEPYEVDDTTNWSGQFNTVYLNDSSTLDRHRNAHYLPVAYDPWVHKEAPAAKKYAVGFIGGHNPIRERVLLKLLDAGLLSYVVGGPWKNNRLRQLCLAENIPAAQTAALYQQTRLIINVFRDLHHFNRRKISGWSLNPRVYEALACGALVVSERRPEMEKVFPELPSFADENELVTRVRQLLEDTETCERLRVCCGQRLAKHRYAQRLATVLAISLPAAAEKSGLVQNEPAPSARPVMEEIRGATPGGKIQDGCVLNDSHSMTSIRHHSRPVEPLPFTAMPRRNLIYHLWPVKGSIWQWNLDQLKQHIDLFNGRRIIAIVHDDKSQTPEIAMEYLDGHGCEFIVEPNDPTGECITFPRMIREIVSRDPNEITFYAHGKGVKYEPNVPKPVLRWAEVQYRTSLDDWLTVWDQLQQFAMTGPFKRVGRYRTHQNLGDWHYCGTFFWMRHASVFARDCLDIPRFYGGVEAWPGIFFKESETGCLFLNTQRQAPYLEHFWRALGDPALRRWQSSVRSIPPPADLVQPLPMDGYEWPRAEQKPDELAWWIQRLLAADVRRLLTIGALQGGVEWHIARIFREQGRDIEITSVDLHTGPELQKAFQDARERFGQSMHLIEGASASEAVRRALHDRYDAVFIDSDHGYRSVRSDWLLAQSLRARLVGFHDIVDSHWHVQNRCCVSRLWAELKAEHETEEKASGDWGGIGVVRLQ